MRWESAAWTEARGAAAEDCSAVAYFFACRLQDELGVPIGLVDAAVGGTPAEAWMPAATAKRFPRVAAEITAMVEAEDARARQGELSPVELGMDFLAALGREGLPASPDSIPEDEWGEQPGRSHFENGPVGPHDGAVWLARDVVIPESFGAPRLTLELPAIDDFDVTLVGGEVVGSTFAKGSWNKPRRYTIPSPVSASVGYAWPFSASIPVAPAAFTGRARSGSRTAQRPWVSTVPGGWRRVLPRTTCRRSPPSASSPTSNRPCFGMHGRADRAVHLRGIIWYQGESNRDHAEEYRALFPLLIASWREAFGNAWDLPFHFVQIAPYDYGKGWDDGLGTLRMAQAGALDLPATRMVVTCDIGNPRDIHPKNKWTVGDRLARFALHDLFGKSDAAPFGPVAAGGDRDRKRAPPAIRPRRGRSDGQGASASLRSGRHGRGLPPRHRADHGAR